MRVESIPNLSELKEWVDKNLNPHEKLEIDIYGVTIVGDEEFKPFLKEDK